MILFQITDSSSLSAINYADTCLSQSDMRRKCCGCMRARSICIYVNNAFPKDFSSKRTVSHVESFEWVVGTFE